MKYPQLVSMPSEISDWLEEQLEARGIDAVVYTRYVISLLNRDSVDIVSPDQDLHLTQLNKEVRRSGSGRKRFRYFSEWREYTQTDAEELKRSAAIECLMSASDQNWGIESLVDELREKLKEVKSDLNTNTASTASSKNSDFQTTSPQDLARKYYAAFPPLNNRHSQTPSNLVNFIPKCFTSPKKKGARRQNRSASFDDKLHYKVDNDTLKKTNSKQRLGYFSKSRNELGYSRSMAKSMERSESMTDWDLFLFKNNTKNKLGNKSLDKFGNIAEEKATSMSTEVNEKRSKPDDSRYLWNDEESMNICDDLPVDILELLDSPSPPEYEIEMMNLANMRNAGHRNFIQNGTNVTTSIWSFDAGVDNRRNTYSTSRDQSETILGIKFKSLTVGNNNLERIWSNPTDIEETDTNLFFENYKKSSFLNPTNSNSFYSDFPTSNPWINAGPGMERFEKWSDAENFDDEDYLQNVTKSLIKLNHNREESSFMEVTPKSNSVYNIFNRPITMTHFLPQETNSDEDGEDLLTSMKNTFRPIHAVKPTVNVNRIKKQQQQQPQYPDGTTFVISGNLDTPNYKRSDSGSLYLEVNGGSLKKLFEYKAHIDKSSKSALVLKFFVHQNDKACQTEISDDSDIEMENPQEVPYKKRVVSEPEEFFFPGDEEMLKDEQKISKYQQTNDDESKMGASFDIDYNSDFKEVEKSNMLAEMWNGESQQCEKCYYAKSVWNSDWMKNKSIESIWQLDGDSLENIWNGAKVCSSCLSLNGGRLPPNSQQSQLREDISQDGEQLLSDLSILQKSYMEQLPVSEISYDISELITGSKERKRRHSPTFEAAKNAVPVHRGSWTIASHLKQDRLMQMTSIPVLHSVTL